MKIESIHFTRHFTFLVRFSLLGIGEDEYMDYAISTPAEFLPPEEDAQLLTELFVEMIKRDYKVPETIISPVTNEEYLSTCGLDFFYN